VETNRLQGDIRTLPEAEDLQQELHSLRENVIAAVTYRNRLQDEISRGESQSTDLEQKAGLAEWINNPTVAADLRAEREVREQILSELKSALVQAEIEAESARQRLLEESERLNRHFEDILAPGESLDQETATTPAGVPIDARRRSREDQAEAVSSEAVAPFEPAHPAEALRSVETSKPPVSSVINGLDPGSVVGLIKRPSPPANLRMPRARSTEQVFPVVVGREKSTKSAIPVRIPGMEAASPPAPSQPVTPAQPAELRAPSELTAPAHETPTRSTPPATRSPQSQRVRVIQPGSASLKSLFTDLWTARELLFFLTWRDIKVRYKQTALGVLWAILQPVISMIVLSIFFGKLAGIAKHTGNTPYPVFVYAGLLPWTFFANALGNSSNSVVGNAGLVTKVRFPRLALPLAAAAGELVDLCLAFTVLLGLMLWYHVPLTPRLLWTPLLTMGVGGIGVGLGAIFASLTVKYRDFRYLLPFVTQIWMFMTPVIYPGSVVPAAYRWVLYANPLNGWIGGFRWALLGYPLPWSQLAVSAVATLLILAIGVWYFRTTERRFAEII
jgi:lipopolysaccharide transport system permease protein